MSWDQYNQTPASNDLANYFQTGMAPSKVKNAGWDIMADLAQFMSLPTSGGTANAQTVTNTRQIGALFTGLITCFIPGNTNTGTPTVAVDGLAAKSVLCNGVGASAGMLAANIPAWLRYDGTQWQLLNPQRATGSFTGTLTGCTTSPTATINYAIEADGKGIAVWCAAGLTATSNTTACTITGAPTLIKSATSLLFPMLVQNSASITAGSVNLNTSTVITLGAPGASGFANTSTKGWAVGAAARGTLD